MTEKLLPCPFCGSQAASRDAVGFTAECNECGSFSPQWNTRALAARQEGVREALWACTGCGTMKTIEQIRGEHPDALSCCPERKMAPQHMVGVEQEQNK